MSTTVTMMQPSPLFCCALATVAAAFVSPAPGRAASPALRAGPPQYDAFDATLVANDVVGRASHLLRLESGATDLSYEPGHVLALEVFEDGDWLKGPYTVSRATESTFDVVVRVVGKKSEAMSRAAVGSTWRFGGKFHVPILEGVAPRATRAICISAEAASASNGDRPRERERDVFLVGTGTGIGPALGFAEQALEGGRALEIDVVAGFREPADVCCQDAVQRLCCLHPDAFRAAYVLSAGPSPDGRVTAKKTVESVAARADRTTHFHLIGNGAMVNEWRAGLKGAGVPEDLVTTETYFNHKAEPDPAVVDHIAAALATTVVDAEPPSDGHVTFLEGGVML